MLARPQCGLLDSVYDRWRPTWTDSVTIQAAPGSGMNVKFKAIWICLASGLALIVAFGPPLQRSSAGSARSLTSECKKPSMGAALLQDTFMKSCSANELMMRDYEVVVQANIVDQTMGEGWACNLVEEGSVANWTSVASSMRFEQKQRMPSECRQRLLAEELKKDATNAWHQHQKYLRSAMKKHFHSIWIRYMDQLFSHEMKDSAQFNRYTELDWKPAFWGWTANDVQTTAKLQTLRSHHRHDWDEVWPNYLELISWNPYGTPRVVKIPDMLDEHSSSKISISDKNAVSLWYIETLLATTGLDISDFSSIIDYGGGSATQCQTFFRFGFGGSYIIYDLIPVHLLQRYFLRMAGFPVVTAYKPGEDASSIEISKHKSILLEGGFVTLVSDTKVLAKILPESGSQFHRKRKRNPSKQPTHTKSVRLFFATYSLSESPMALREEIAPIIQGFDVFYVWFADSKGLTWDKPKGRSRWGSNFLFFQQFLERIGRVSFCIWRGGNATSEGSYGFVAMRPEFGTVKCAEIAQCTEKSTVKCGESPALL
jgi:hypothetical protein